MGREATCQLHWGQETAACKVLLESNEMIVRGAIMRRVRLSTLQDVSTKGNKLTFRIGQETVALALGPVLAAKWAKAIATPPPGLADKLGMKPGVRLRVIGNLDDEKLTSAVAAAVVVSKEPVDLVLLRASTQSALDGAISHLHGKPVWVVYPKGAGQDISENQVRATFRAVGYMDTKVASVSPTLTALRFQRSAKPEATEQTDTRRLRDICGVGPAVEADLLLLQVQTVAQLAKANGDVLYHELCEKTGQRQDPCVLDVFRCAVAQAADPNLPAEQTNCWWWSRRRKAGQI